MLKLELASVIAEKVDDICLYCTVDVVCALLKEHKDKDHGKKVNRSIPNPWYWQWESPIHLQLNQQLSYQYRIENEFK